VFLTPVLCVFCKFLICWFVFFCVSFYSCVGFICICIFHSSCKAAIFSKTIRYLKRRSTGDCCFRRCKASILESILSASATQAQRRPSPIFQRSDVGAGEEIRQSEILVTARETTSREISATDWETGCCCCCRCCCCLHSCRAYVVTGGANIGVFVAFHSKHTCIAHSPFLLIPPKYYGGWKTK